MSYRQQKEKTSLCGDAGQVIGLVVVGIGVGIELAYEGHWALVMITIGSVVFAVGTKLKGR